MSTYTEDIVLGVRPFTQQRDGDDVIIGIQETGLFLAIPAEAVELLEEFARGKSVGEVASDYERKYGETPDLEDFLGLLEAKGVVERCPEGSTGVKTFATATQAPERRYHFAKFPQSIAKLIFGKVTITGSLLSIALALAAIVRDSWLMPRPADLIFTNRLTLTWTILGLLNIAGVFAHEMAHLVAARAAGVESRIGIGNRLWYLVAETDLTGLWALRKQQRYVPFLAGMLCDATSASILILVLAARHEGLIGISAYVVSLMRAMIFTYSMAIAWQFFLFMRTDMYFVISTAFNCRSLLADTEVYLRNQLAALIPAISRRDQSAIPLRELRVIRCYAVIWTAGRIWSLTTLLFVALPVGLSYLRHMAAVAHTGYAANPSAFTDAAILAFYFLAPIVAGFIMWMRSLFASKRS